MPRGVYQHPTRYTPEERGRGMEALAVFGGSCTKAHNALAKQGLHIPMTTLSAWKHRHEQEYRQVRERVLPRILAKQAEGTDRIVDEATEVELAYLARVKEELPNVPAKQLAADLRSVSVTKGIAVTKGLELRGHPTTNTDHPAYEEIINRLDKLGLIEGEATEIPEEQPQLEEAA